MSLEEKLIEKEEIQEKSIEVEIKRLDCIECEEFQNYIFLREKYYEEFFRGMKPSKKRLTNLEIEAVREKDIFLSYILNQNEKIIVGYVSGKEWINRITFQKEYLSTHIYVLPNYRSLRIAKKLKEKQIEHAKKTRCERIITTVDKNNIASLRLQESLGAKMYLEKSKISYKVEIEL